MSKNLRFDNRRAEKLFLQFLCQLGFAPVESVPSGRVAYAVLSFGGLFGIGDKLFAIPWSALQLDTDNHCFVLSTSKEKLKQAQGFDQDHWPSMADQRWALGVHEFYGARPYWEVAE